MNNVWEIFVFAVPLSIELNMNLQIFEILVANNFYYMYFGYVHTLYGKISNGVWLV